MPQKSTVAPAPGQIRAFIASLSGRQLGAFKTAAIRLGLSFDDYLDRIDAGQKHCIRCREWKPVSAFNVDESRWDGRVAKCQACQSRIRKETYVPVPPEKRKPFGPPPKPSRDGDKIQARQLVNCDIRRGLRPNPNDLHCVLCGHKGSDRRHEYHHHMGYGARHHYDVIPLCTTCHHEEH